jgi:hypothetical protein
MVIQRDGLEVASVTSVFGYGGGTGAYAGAVAGPPLHHAPVTKFASEQGLSVPPFRVRPRHLNPYIRQVTFLGGYLWILLVNPVACEVAQAAQCIDLPRCRSDGVNHKPAATQSASRGGGVHLIHQPRQNKSCVLTVLWTWYCYIRTYTNSLTTSPVTPRFISPIPRTQRPAKPAQSWHTKVRSSRR